jgi:hypothetical protein
MLGECVSHTASRAFIAPLKTMQTLRFLRNSSEAIRVTKLHHCEVLRMRLTGHPGRRPAEKGDELASVKHGYRRAQQRPVVVTKAQAQVA